MKHLFLKLTLTFIMAMVILHSCKKDVTTILPAKKPVTTTQKTDDPGTLSAGAMKQPGYSYKDPAGNAQTMPSIFGEKHPDKEFFTVDITSGVSFTSKSKSQFYIYAGSILDASNQVVTGTVDVELVEYRTKADMIFSGVTTVADEGILESGAMFSLTMKQNGNELHMKPGATFYAKLAQTNTGPEPMLRWKGVTETGSNNKVKWQMTGQGQLLPKLDTAYLMTFFSGAFGGLGFHNCDRLLVKAGKDVKKFCIKLPEGYDKTNTAALIIFKNYNAASWLGWTNEGLSSGYKFPIDETCKVLFFRKTGMGEDDLEYLVKEITLQETTTPEYNDNFQACTKAALTAAIKVL